MIVNREILTGCDPDGNVTKTELISYVGADGTIKFLNYPIPKDWWFNWSYSRYGDRSADPYYRSWDGKPVTGPPVTAEGYEKSEKVRTR